MAETMVKRQRGNASKVSQVMREKDQSWSNYPDFSYHAKNVGTWRIELVGGTDRGALINIWSKAKNLMKQAKDLDFEFSIDGNYTLFTTARFMNFVNAKERYTYADCNEEIKELAKETY